MRPGDTPTAGKPSRRWVIGPVLLLLALVIGARWLGHHQDTVTAPPASAASAPATVLIAPVEALPAPSAAAPAAAPRPAIAARPQDLYGAFQLALGSTDLTTLERGLGAYEECFLYANPGGPEGYVADNIPPNLDRAEYDRRAAHLRQRARRCAGFANQDVQSRLKAMREAAVAAGSMAERARQAAWEPGSPDEQARVACAIVQGLPASNAAVRFIGPALTKAASQRADHVLRQSSPPVPALAVSLTLCDLDAASCSRMLGSADSACAQEGLCDLTSDRDYLQRTTPPEQFAAASALAQQVEALVASKDCMALFQ